MTPDQHATTEQVADLAEGLLPEAEAVEVRAHLDECPACQEVRARLAAVSDLLAAEGAVAPAIPAEVSAAIRTTLERESARRAAGVPSLDERRVAATDDDEPSRRRRPWLMIAAAAAAAVVVAGSALSVVAGGDGDSMDAGSAGDGAGVSSLPEAGERDSGAAGGGSGDGAAPETAAQGPQAYDQRLRPEKLGEYAGLLATGQADAVTPRGDCAVVADEQPTDLIVSQYGGGSERALMLVDGGAGTYRLVDCETGALVARGTF